MTKMTPGAAAPFSNFRSALESLYAVQEENYRLNFTYNRRNHNIIYPKCEPFEAQTWRFKELSFQTLSVMGNRNRSINLRDKIDTPAHFKCCRSITEINIFEEEVLWG
ncbi:hypothetical protein AVEN_61280-1 [Araneus ventricosus]|uniref:Uncharacterized protein n=1 Tax=Araneus ventricosus TaxID=182803 RepID=A0A4Y2SIV8_ARAVE|nr:hypothetical protein AVEN_61280-1 [Araneus ventricosus]